MYQSLYRKYRPNTFDEVSGQNVIIKTLKNAINSNHLSHAYLFTGPRGTGKTSVAKILAKTINCTNLKECIPCNKCVSCTQIKNKQTTDIIEIDAASNNGVDEIREIKNKVNLVPSIGKYKVYIIDEVHMLTTGAFNALLKTLEEPPAHAIFILATTEPHKIPSTILSRCQRFDFKKIGTIDMIQKLKYIIEQEKIETTDEVLMEICRLSDGCMRDALSLLDQVSSYSENKITIDDIHEINGTLSQKQLEEIIIQILNKDYHQLFKTLDQLNQNGKNFVKLMEEMILYFRNVLIAKNVPNYFNDNENIYTNISNILEEKQIINYLKLLNNSLYNIKNTNNPKMLFEIYIIEMMNQQDKEQEIKNVDREQSQKKEVKESLKQEPKTEIKKQKNIENNIDTDVINKIKKIRINNSLYTFNKKYLKELISKIDEIRSLIINPDFTEYASIIVDGNLKVAGGENLLFVYNNKYDSEQFNQNIIEIDKMLLKYFETPYKSIAISLDEWNLIKDEYNNKKKEYKYIEEPKNIETLKKSSKKLEEAFEDIIEYI